VKQHPVYHLYPPRASPRFFVPRQPDRRTDFIIVFRDDDDGETAGVICCVLGSSAAAYLLIGSEFFVRIASTVETQTPGPPSHRSMLKAQRRGRKLPLPSHRLRTIVTKGYSD
jgi:hypothetical protein